jgi:hypothetical protein
MSDKLPKTHETTTFTLSHSSMETMSKCLHSWYLKYIELNYPNVVNPVTAFGKFCHKIAEHYQGNGIEELRELYKKYKDDYVITDEYKAKFPKAMKRLAIYYDKVLSKSLVPIKREKGFRLGLDEYIDVTGFIDVMYKNPENEWVIVDYKTSKKFGNYFEQFAFYYYLLWKQTGKRPKKLKFEAMYFCANEGYELKNFVQYYTLEEKDIDFSDERINNCLDTIVKLGVTDKEKWKKRPGPLCPWCDYFIAGICEGNKIDFNYE